MRHASVKTNLGDSHTSENCPGNERLERRWNRRDAINASLKQNGFISATRTNVNICENVSADKNDCINRANEEVDGDYALILDEYSSDNDSRGDKNVCGSNTDVNTGNNNNINEEEDEDYALYLAEDFSDNETPGDNNVFGSNIDVNTSNSNINEEEDEDYALYLAEDFSGNDSPDDKNVCGSNIDVNTDDNINEEEDEDYALYLAEDFSDNESPGDNNVYGPNIDVNTGYDNINEEVNEHHALSLDEHFSDDDSAGDSNVFGSNIDFNTSYNNINEEEDEDYALYLAEDFSDSESPGDNNVFGSNIDFNTGYNNINENQALSLNEQFFDDDSPGDSDVFGSNIDVNSSYNDDGCDPDYSYFLNNYYNNHIQCDGEKGGEERFRNKLKFATKMSKVLNVEKDDVDEDYALFLYSSSIDGDSLAHTGNGLFGKSSSVRQHSQVSNMAVDTPPEVEDRSKISKALDTSNDDEDYLAYLNSDSDLLDKPVKNTTKTSKLDGGNSSSDSDLIILEDVLICENTPFVTSKTFDSSFFETEGGPRDNNQIYADDHSPFRRRLMEDLQRPYDHQEYIKFLEEVNEQKQQERFINLRKPVNKPYHTNGFCQSYLQMYPGLHKAVIEFKSENAKVLFILRGFFFWLKNVSHDGVFKPWDDESLLETLRKQ